MPTAIMLYDKFENKSIRASHADVTLYLNDPSNIASLQNGDVVIANNSGVFSVTVSYFGQKNGTIKIGVTVLSVKDTFFEYYIESSNTVRLDDMNKINLELFKCSFDNSNIDWRVYFHKK